MCSGVRNTSTHELTSKRMHLPFDRALACALLTFAELAKQSALLTFDPNPKLPLLSFAADLTEEGVDAPELFRGVAPELFWGVVELHLGAGRFWERIRVLDRFWESDPDLASHFLATRPGE